MKYSPKPQARQTGIVTAVLIVLAIITYIFSVSGITPAIPLQMITFVCLIAAAYILIRYRFTYITYIIRPRSENEADLYGDDILSMPSNTLDFAVKRAQGKREGALECLLSIDKLCEICDYKGSASTKALREKYNGIKMYNYTVSMIKPSCTALVFDDGTDIYGIVCELDEKMKSFFVSRLKATENATNENNIGA